MQEDLLSSICAIGAPQGPVRLQCYPRNLEDWLGVPVATVVHTHLAATVVHTLLAAPVMQTHLAATPVHMHHAATVVHTHFAGTLMLTHLAAMALHKHLAAHCFGHTPLCDCRADTFDTPLHSFQTCQPHMLLCLELLCSRICCLFEVAMLHVRYSASSWVSLTSVACL